MEYERLTDKNDLYWALQETKLSAEVGIYLTDCLNRLAEFEDKMEKGTLKEIPENAVVLTEDNAEELGNMIVESPQMQAAMKNLIKEWRKETAEQFAEMAKSKSRPTYVNIDDNPRKDSFILLSDIDEICKEISEGKV